MPNPANRNDEFLKRLDGETDPDRLMAGIKAIKGVEAALKELAKPPPETDEEVALDVLKEKIWRADIDVVNVSHYLEEACAADSTEDLRVALDNARDEAKTLLADIESLMAATE